MLGHEQVVLVYFGDDDLYPGHVDDADFYIFGALAGKVNAFVVGEADGGFELAERDIGGIFFMEDAADAAADRPGDVECVALGLVEIFAADDETRLGRLCGELDCRAEGDGAGKVGSDDLLAGVDTNGAGRPVVLCGYVPDGQDIGGGDGGFELYPRGYPIGAAFGQQTFFDSDLCVDRLVFHLQIEQAQRDAIGRRKGLKGIVDGRVTDEDTQFVLELVGVDGIVELKFDLGDRRGVVLILQ